MARENARRFYVKVAIGLFIGAAILLDLGFFPRQAVHPLLAIYILGAGYCVVWAGLYLRRAYRAAPEARVALPMDGAPVSSQIAVNRRLLWISAVAFPVLTAWTAYDLHQLDVGAAKEVRVFLPVAPLYHHVGFWPAVCFVPALGIFCCAVFVIRIRRLKATGDPHA